MANYEELPKASLIERPIKRHEEKKLDDEIVQKEKEDGSLENSISTGDLGDAIAYQHPIAHHHQLTNHSPPPPFIFTTRLAAVKPQTCADPVPNPLGSSTNSDDLEKKATGFISLWEEGIPSLNSISPQTSNSGGQELQQPQQIRDDPVSNSLGNSADNGGLQKKPAGFISLWEEDMPSLNMTPPRTSNFGGQKLCDGENDCTGDSGGGHFNSFLPPSRLSRDEPIQKIEKECQESIRMYAQLEKNWKLVKACSFV